MLRLLSNITIIQQPTADLPVRNLSFTLNGVTGLEYTSSWKNKTDTCKLTFPKNIYFTNQDGKKVNWQGQNITGDTISLPLLLRGDKITISLGYEYLASDNSLRTQMNEEFTGYISSINPKMPLEIECEDNMFLLKRAVVPNKQYTGTVQQMLEDMFAYASENYSEFASAGLTVSKFSEVSAFSSFITNNETIGQVLARLQKEYHLESYFRGAELRCNATVYYPNESNTPVFQFQKNIIEDKLEYRRTDDYQMGIKAYSVSRVAQSSTRKDGKSRKVTKRLSVFVTKNSKGEIIETNEQGWQGEKRTQYFQTTDLAQLKLWAGQALNRVFYEGFKGEFTSFGLPFVKHGDNVILRNTLLPEFNGTYKVKQVKVEFGGGGFRRKIELDIRIDTLSTSDLSFGL